MYSSKEILDTYIDFYKERGHKLTPNVSLVPEGDSTLLYVNSGMFPLVPYLMGEEHPLGKRLVNAQRSMRFNEDFEQIGDTIRHTTAFHMLGNWSLGDYFKAEQLPWVFELMIDVLGLDPKKIYATVYEGDAIVSKDTESIAILQEIYKKYGIDAKEGVRIFALGKDNWWKRGDAVGELGGPSSEIFYFVGEEGTGEGLNLPDHDDLFLEIGNSVFMQYIKTETGWDPLKQKNVDFGGGLERIAMCVQGKTDIFVTDNFLPLIEDFEQLSGKKYNDNTQIRKAMRVMSDHIRATSWLAMDGVMPSNKDQGYFLRRILRRFLRYAQMLEIKGDIFSVVVPTVAENLSWIYPQLKEKQDQIIDMFKDEQQRFESTIKRVTPKVQKYLAEGEKTEEEFAQISFDLFQSEGYPKELFLDELKERGIEVDTEKFMDAYQQVFQKHQDTSRQGSEQKFKSGLADNSEEVIKYHTTTHLLQMALRKVLGNEVRQKGSNNTKDRLRFDFNYAEKLTDGQIKEVEEVINSTIAQKLPVTFVAVEREEGKKTGALYLPDKSYPEQVKVYYIGETIEKAISKEFCDGPHVQNLSELSDVEIFKQETIGKGLQRVYVRFKKA